MRLSEWSRGLFSKAKVHLHAALLVILRLDIAQESRLLSPEERDLRARLKRRVISLAVLEKARKKQCARIANIKEGDANTRCFHLRVNHRRRKKNLIHRLKHNQGWVTSHEDKEKIVHSHFKNIAKKGPARNIGVNWGLLPTPNCNLQGLDEAFTEEVVKAAVFQLPGDKAPGPDGFKTTFLKACWNTIKPDIMLAVNRFSNLQTAHLLWLNLADVSLIPKKDGAEDISDFRPISLIHAIAKIIAKMMSNRLAPHMNELVSHA